MNKEKIYIKKARKDDFEELRVIFLEERKRNFVWMDSDDIRIEDFDKSTEGELILVAFIKDEIIGFASVWEEDKFIHNLFVKSSFKRRGAGKALIKECKNNVGLPLTLKCVQENKSALGFYLNEGFEIVEKVEGKEPYYLMKYNL